MQCYHQSLMVVKRGPSWLYTVLYYTEIHFGWFQKGFFSSVRLFSSNTNLCDSGYYDYDDYYNNMQGYEAYMQKWAIYSSWEKTLNLLSSSICCDFERKKYSKKWIQARRILHWLWTWVLSKGIPIIQAYRTNHPWFFVIFLAFSLIQASSFMFPENSFGILLNASP